MLTEPKYMKECQILAGITTRDTGLDSLRNWIRATESPAKNERPQFCLVLVYPWAKKDNFSFSYTKALPFENCVLNGRYFILEAEPPHIKLHWVLPPPPHLNDPYEVQGHDSRIQYRGPVHTYPFSFSNDFFLRFQKKIRVHTKRFWIIFCRPHKNAKTIRKR